MDERLRTARTERMLAEFLERDAVIRTMYRWGYATDRQDWPAVEACTVPGLKAELWLNDRQVVDATGRDVYVGAAAGMFSSGLRASLHSYSPSFDVTVEDDRAHARWAGNIANAFGDGPPERGEGLADAWFVRDDESDTGWRAERIVFRYVWGYDGLVRMMSGGA